MPTFDKRFMPGRLFLGGVPDEVDAADIIARIGRLPGTKVLSSELIRDVASHGELPHVIHISAFRLQ